MDLDNNVKGYIGEEIASHFINKRIRCKRFQPDIINDYSISDTQKEFLRKNWKYLDIIRFNDNIQKMEIYEVKSRKYVPSRKPIWNKHAISPFVLNIYELAIKLNMDVKIFEILFYKDWNFSYIIKQFDKKHFSISKTRGQGSNYKNYFLNKK